MTIGLIETPEIITVVKRDGTKVDYNENKVFQAILSAFIELDLIKEGFDNNEILKEISDLTTQVTIQLLDEEFDSITVDEIQEEVFDTLLNSEYKDVAKSYIQYAERKNIQRENLAKISENSIDNNTNTTPITEKLKKIKIIKKNGRIENYNEEKLRKAINSAASEKVSKGLMSKLVSKINEKVIKNIENYENENIDLTTENLHDFVEETLTEIAPEIYEQYAIYRRYKKNMSKSYDAARKDTERILYDGDKENANRDSQLNSTKQTLTAEAFMKTLVRDFELSPEIRKAHDEGWLYIHDIGARYLRQINCCLFDMGNVLKGGFTMNGAKYLEPKSFASAIALVGDVTLQASGQQYGGFTVPEIDTILAPYAERSYQKHLNTLQELEGIDEGQLEKLALKMTLREIEQGIQGYSMKLNTISSSLGQIPFNTITFGLNTSFWGREIIKAILKDRLEGIGEEKITAVFPKLVMLMRKEINRDEDAPNRDLYDLAIKCSQKRLYPDYLSLDGADIGNNLAEIFERSGQVVSPMGCRAYLSPYWNGDKEIYIGRGNTGAVTLNLPKIAIEAKGDINKFYEMVDVYSELIWDFHESYINKVGKQKASTSPLFFSEGGSWKKLNPDDEISSVIEAFTSSLGYIGIEETIRALTGGSLKDHQELGLEIVSHLKENVDNATKTRGFLAALYSTPAESLCYTFQKRNRAQYGEIKGVTDREYMTNSFHIPVWEEITVPEKIAFEAPFHKIATGGRISYTEFPHGTPTEVLQEAVDFAMDSGDYFGVNIISSSCSNCYYEGDFRESCPKCGSSDITVVSRVCGYLSFERMKGDKDGRYNPGKKAEVLERVKHYKKVSE